MDVLAVGEPEVAPTMTDDDVFALIDGIDFSDTGADFAEVVWLTSGQPIVWPMRLHVHGNDCARA